MSPHNKFDCYLCEKTFGGRKLGSTIGSGKFINNICKKCTEDNYCWDHNLVPNHAEIARRYKELQA